jgi:hypothetical protein
LENSTSLCSFIVWRQLIILINMLNMRWQGNSDVKMMKYVKWWMVNNTGIAMIIYTRMKLNPTCWNIFFQIFTCYFGLEILIVKVEHVCYNWSSTLQDQFCNWAITLKIQTPGRSEIKNFLNIFSWFWRFFCWAICSRVPASILTRDVYFLWMNLGNLVQ